MARAIAIIIARIIFSFIFFMAAGLPVALWRCSRLAVLLCIAAAFLLAVFIAKATASVFLVFVHR